MRPRTPKRPALDAAIAFCLHSVGPWRRASEAGRLPIMRAQRAKLKSHRDDMKVAQGKRGTSAALDPLPRAAASAALPWAAILLPLRGAGQANQMLEPIAAGPSACDNGGRFAARGSHRRLVSGGCSSPRALRTQASFRVRCHEFTYEHDRNEALQ